MKHITALVVLLAAACSTSCGYSLAGRGSFLPADIGSVGIPMLVNASTFFDVEQVLTEITAELWSFQDAFK